jgi:hypothetical protein
MTDSADGSGVTVSGAVTCAKTGELLNTIVAATNNQLRCTCNA